MKKNYKGVYDKRLVGLYNNKLIYCDKEQGYIIGDPYLRKPTKDELKGIKEKFGDLEKKVREFRIL